MLQSEERLSRLERMTELPLLVLALALIPLLVLPEIANLGATTETAFLVADWCIWGIFAVDFGVKLAVAPQRLGFVRDNWLEALMVLLPVIRPLRAVRILRFVRVATVIGFNTSLVQEILNSRGTRFIAVALIVICVASAVLVTLAERQEESANITSFGDALWWSLATVTTVGYGDHFPVSPFGRGVAVALMLFGIAALSAVTASIAAFLVQNEEEANLQSQLEEVLGRLGDVQQELAALRRQVGRG